ncbi:putative RNA helicase [Cavenderia fasciculata]|uniref:RNA helicase n=1 Tax=Cavenderia fasciculata TaxID=261658 RepID=F4Q3I8_CACFS|nr:putative RNA helicase [Cavenderia fasciculata]EGG17646.1 putative RNA helicase [Cavenderia fasciculata]|eukprot:XP_004356130.1 putative RNA helicase [Cavenderia fasciculata]
MVVNKSVKRKVDDFVMTIDDDDEEIDTNVDIDEDDESEAEEDEVEEIENKKKKKTKKQKESTTTTTKNNNNNNNATPTIENEDDMDEEFDFEEGAQVVLPWDFAPTIEKMKRTQPSNPNITSLEDKIKKRLDLKKFKGEDTKVKVEGDGDDQELENESDDEDIKDNEEKEQDESDSDSDSEVEEVEEVEEEEQKVPKNNNTNKSIPKVKVEPLDTLKTLESNKRMKKEVVMDLPTFEELHLSRPLQKAVAKLGYTQPTPIQAKAIPLILNGKDILASATTGSGKTAAFILPILERLLYRDATHRVSRVLIVLPTRELALQCHSVFESLAQFTNVQSCLVVGGLSNKVQEHELRKRPDVIIATPGRLIDHLLNAHDVGLEDIEILVLDEADRLLDMGFKDELNRVVESCPDGRQTLLFSATLSDDVKLLAKLSLSQPVRVAVDALFQVASTLEQEFIKIKPGQLADRTAMLLSLCTRVFNGGGCIVFFRSKKEVHRIAILLGLSGLKVGELHGDLNQEQRFEALQSFRNGEVDFLLATDIAARGLDVLGVRTVINYNMPRSLAQYIHRVGRTARAGLAGRSCSFITEADRKILKDIVSRAKTKAKSRTVAQESIKLWRAKIDEMTDDVKDIIREELRELDFKKTEKDLMKAERIVANALGHKKLITDNGGIIPEAAPMERVWFQSKKEREESREAWKTENGIVSMDKDGKPVAGGKPARKGVLLKKAPKDPYAGMSRKKRRSVMHREEMARDMAEQEDAFEGGSGGQPSKKEVAKKFRSEQNNQRASGKETKRIEALRRAGIYAGPTPQEKLKLDAKQAKKTAQIKKKKVGRDDFEKDITSISEGKSSFKKGKVVAKSKSS